jgi:hypothetical protein
MGPVAESIEALADSIVATRPSRNTIVETLRGFARYVIQEHENAPLRSMTELEKLVAQWRAAGQL